MYSEASSGERRGWTDVVLGCRFTAKYPDARSLVLAQSRLGLSWCLPAHSAGSVEVRRLQEAWCWSKDLLRACVAPSTFVQGENWSLSCALHISSGLLDVKLLGVLAFDTLCRREFSQSEAFVARKACMKLHMSCVGTSAMSVESLFCAELATGEVVQRLNLSQIGHPRSRQAQFNGHASLL